MTAPQAEVTVTIRKGRSEETHRFYCTQTLAESYEVAGKEYFELVTSTIHSYSTETRTRLP